MMYIHCGECGAFNAVHLTQCVACQFQFTMNKNNEIKRCKNPDCWRGASHSNGLCKHHAERRVAAQRVTAMQANCNGCNNKLSLERTERGAAYCVKCEERHAYAREVSPLQVASVEVEVEKLRELLQYVREVWDASADLTLFEYFDKLMVDK